MSNRRYDLNRGPDSQGKELDFIYTPSARSGREEGLNARLLYVSAAKYEEDWHSTLHAHDFSELFYIIGGKGQFIVEAERLEVRADDLLVVNPHAVHTELSLGTHPLEYIVLGIEGLAFHMGEGRNDSYFKMHFDQGNEELKYLLRMLLREVQGTDAERIMICQNLLNVLLLQMLRHQTIAFSNVPAKNASKECAAVRRYIEDHFKESLTLDELAEKAHLNKFYMSHEFKDTYGLSPINYLIECRVSESKYLLLDTNYSLSEIAAIVGFSSASYFSQSFKRVAGITPNDYRKKKKMSAK